MFVVRGDLLLDRVRLVDYDLRGACAVGHQRGSFACRTRTKGSAPLVALYSIHASVVDCGHVLDGCSHSGLDSKVRFCFSVSLFLCLYLGLCLFVMLTLSSFVLFC